MQGIAGAWDANHRARRAGTSVRDAPDRWLPLPGAGEDAELGDREFLGVRSRRDGGAFEELIDRDPQRFEARPHRRRAMPAPCPHPLFRLFYQVEIRHRQPPYNDNPASARGDAGARRDTL